jgi:hypothetical protein
MMQRATDNRAGLWTTSDETDFDALVHEEKILLARA